MRKLAVIALVLAVTAATPGAGARTRLPRYPDPRSWELPENMTWSDYTRIPGVQWLNPGNEPPKTLRAALVLGEFADQGFRVAETDRDPTGQKGLGIKDPAQFWVDYLFNSTQKGGYNRGHTVGEYWLEDSYGLVGVEAEAFGPYKLEGNMYEYGATDFGGAEDCPDDSGCSRDFDTELTQASLADVTTAQQENGEFDFRYLLHAGYDESGVWLNFGQMLFKVKEAVTEEFGPKAYPEHRNWGTTRYVDWTSFFATQQIWSHALPGTLSTQGESDGGSTYAHELSHILGVLDNYNNPYADNPDRAYAGPWDMMDRGTFNGPGGPWERWQIPPVEGGMMGSQHMLRNKIRMGFTPASEARTISKADLTSLGVVKVDILQRESPPPVDDPNLFSGIRIVLGQDQSSCDDNEPLCDGGGYDYYDVEVVNRQGFDSFLPDHGVIIAKTKSADASPYIWVVDAFPKDINKVDYVRADGKRFKYTIGDYRQLADAAFHYGGAPKTQNRYVDEANGIAFNIVGRRKVEGRLIYSVAVQSLDAAPLPRDPAVEKVKGTLKPGRVTKQVFNVTNTGQGDAVYKIVTKKKLAKTRLMNNLIFVPAGGSQKVVVWAKPKNKKAAVTITAEIV